MHVGARWCTLAIHATFLTIVILKNLTFFKNDIFWYATFFTFGIIKNDTFSKYDIFRNAIMFTYAKNYVFN